MTAIDELRAAVIADMQAEVRKVNEEKGWWDEPVTFERAIANLHGEVSEAWEAWRKWGTDDATEEFVPGSVGAMDAVFQPPEPEGVGSEFADILIRLLDDCERFGVDLVAEYARKLAYNRTRAHRHGNKRA
jgi:NTP pyrophosphatase (non-canonical NTP hydrolase)